MRSLLLLTGLVAALIASLAIWKGSHPEIALNWEGHKAELVELKAKVQNLSEQVKAAAGSGKCLRDDNCRVTGLGAQICGGYRESLIYSDEDTSSARLGRVVRDYNAAAERLHDLSLTVPHCGTALPEVRCVKNKCVPVEP